MSDPGKPDLWRLRFASGLSILCGIGGMLASYYYLSQRDPRDISAGSAGFITGAVLIGAGLISLSLLARRDA